jgi:hypothetical protein
MTAATPIKTPKVVKIDRNLLASKLSQATRNISSQSMHCTSFAS